MSADLLISLGVTLGSVLLVAGGLLVKVNRLEADVKERVTRELFDLHTKGVNEKLDKIEGMLERLYERLLSRRDDSGEQGRRP